MQELYLDKSSGTVSSAQFAQMNRAFWTKQIALKKVRAVGRRPGAGSEHARAEKRWSIASMQPGK